MPSSPTIELNDGAMIPQIGLGVWQATPEDAAKAVKAALTAGYRHVDTASAYRNEDGVGEGLRESGVARDEVFVTTKLWNDAQGFDNALAAFDKSIGRLKLDTIDLYLIHWPMPAGNLYVKTWKALIRLKEEGRVKSIGVSNFEPEHLDRLIGETGVAPVLNQIELHPGFQQQKLRDYHAEKGIATEAWSPLGQGKILENPVLAEIGRKHGRTPAQVILRWHVQIGNIAIPKSVTPSRIVENFDLFGFELDEADMQQIAALDATDGRLGPNPMTASF